MTFNKEQLIKSLGRYAECGQGISEAECEFWNEHLDREHPWDVTAYTDKELSSRLAITVPRNKYWPGGDDEHSVVIDSTWHAQYTVGSLKDRSDRESPNIDDSAYLRIDMVTVDGEKCDFTPDVIEGATQTIQQLLCDGWAPAEMYDDESESEPKDWESEVSGSWDEQTADEWRREQEEMHREAAAHFLECAYQTACEGWKPNWADASEDKWYIGVRLDGQPFVAQLTDERRRLVFPTKGKAETFLLNRERLFREICK